MLLGCGTHLQRIAAHGLSVGGAVHSQSVAGAIGVDIDPAGHKRPGGDTRCLKGGNAACGAGLERNCGADLAAGQSECARGIGGGSGAGVGHLDCGACVGLGCGYGGCACGKSAAGHGDGERLRELHALNRETCLGSLAGGGEAKVERSAAHRFDKYRLLHAAGSPALAHAVAPDVFHQLGVVDEGVAVVLRGIHGIVAVNLLLAHGVLAAPLEQQVDGPRGECGIAVAGQHVAVPRADAAVVGGSHVEVVAGKVALILVVGLKHRAAVAREGASAQLAKGTHAAAGAECVAVGALAIGIVAALAVHLAVGGHNVEGVAHHG